MFIWEKENKKNNYLNYMRGTGTDLITQTEVKHEYLTLKSKVSNELKDIWTRTE